MKEGFRVMGNILKVWVTEVYVFVKTQHIYHAPLYVNITSKGKKMDFSNWYWYLEFTLKCTKNNID